MIDTWQGQTVVIVGAARQGLALARYLLRHGAAVRLTDQRPLERLAEARHSLADLEAQHLPLSWVCGGHPLSLLDGADLVCLSGGAPLDLPLIVAAQQRGIGLSNDSLIFLQAAPCRVVGITGSAGKTTTTTLVGRMAQAAAAQGVFRRAWVGGNIGNPLISDLDEMQPGDLAVMELSSFQLELFAVSPPVAAILNITPNHLDRHGTMAVYSAAKANICRHQQPGDITILGRDDPGAWAWAGQTAGQVLSFGFSPLPAGEQGAWLDGDALWLSGSEQPWLTLSEINLRGRHNVLNVMAAGLIAQAAVLPPAAMQAGVRGFNGVPHRLEWVRRWGGADWYNDSIATAPERAMAAVHAFEQPLIMLVGGRDKKLPWHEFALLAQQRVTHIVAFGEAASLIVAALAQAGAQTSAARLQSIQTVTDLHQAVRTAADLVQPGDVVLLSPGGTSFDAFTDFEERGQCFAQWVNQLP